MTYGSRTANRTDSLFQTVNELVGNVDWGESLTVAACEFPGLNSFGDRRRAASAWLAGETRFPEIIPLVAVLKVVDRVIQFWKKTTENIYFLLQSLTKMAKAVQRRQKDKMTSLFHCGLIKIIIQHELQKQNLTWSGFLIHNQFEEREELLEEGLKEDELLMITYPETTSSKPPKGKKKKKEVLLVTDDENNSEAASSKQPQRRI